MNKINDSGQEYIEEREIGQATERKDVAEMKKVGEPSQASEIGNTERRSHNKQNKKDKSSIMKALQTFAIGGVAIVAIGSATIFQKDEQSANIGDIKASSTKHIDALDNNFDENNMDIFPIQPNVNVRKTLRSMDSLRC